MRDLESEAQTPCDSGGSRHLQVTCEARSKGLSYVNGGKIGFQESTSERTLEKKANERLFTHVQRTAWPVQGTAA